MGRRAADPRDACHQVHLVLLVLSYHSKDGSRCIVWEINLPDGPVRHLR